MKSSLLLLLCFTVFLMSCGSGGPGNEQVNDSASSNNEVDTQAVALAPLVPNDEESLAISIGK